MYASTARAGSQTSVICPKVGGVTGRRCHIHSHIVRSRTSAVNIGPYTHIRKLLRLPPCCQFVHPTPASVDAGCWHYEGAALAPVGPSSVPYMLAAVKCWGHRDPEMMHDSATKLLLAETRCSRRCISHNDNTRIR